MCPLCSCSLSLGGAPTRLSGSHASNLWASLQLERQLRLAVARYKELQLELGQLKAEVEQLRRESGHCEQPATAQGQLSMPAGEAQPQGSPVAVPQPAEDR